MRRGIKATVRVTGDPRDAHYAWYFRARVQTAHSVRSLKARQALREAE